MPVLYLTPASISYLTQFVLSAVITGYLSRRARGREVWRAEVGLLTWFFGFLTLFIGQLFLESAFLPTWRLLVVYLENTTLGLALVFLLQFAYRFPTFSSRRKWESYIALGLSLAYAAWEAWFAIFRFGRLQEGEVLFRSANQDYALLALLLWTPAVFVRTFVSLAWQDDRGGRRGWAALLRPAQPEARAALSFALIYLFVASLSVFNILRNHYLLSAFLSSMSISLGILIALFAFSNVYLNFRMENFPFMAKMAGTTLTVILALLGVVGWVISPAFEMHYVSTLPEGRTLRFAPNDQGGYDVSEIPFVFETELVTGLDLRDDLDDLHVIDQLLAACSPGLAFEFPFYQRTYSQIYVCNDGTVGMGQPPVFRNYQYRYGAGTPLIMALLTDLYPEISPGGVFVLEEADRLVVTWDRMRGFYRQEAEFSFQLVLHHSGVFELSYDGLPPEDSPLLAYHPNDEPAANVWAIGAVPGGTRWERTPQAFSWTGLPVSIGPDGVVQDYLLEFRQHLNELFVPLAWLILVSSLAVIAGVPLLLYVILARPLADLLAGVRKMDEGRLDVQVPVRFHDEIGSLTQSFNDMVVWLRSLVTNLEGRVAARTAELTSVNEQLNRKIDEIEGLQEELREQAIRDPLTSLFNRRYMQETLKREIAQAERRGWQIGVIMMDIDNFKLVNDRSGHQMGDCLLQQLGQLLLSSVRRGDVPCRFGGDEFLLILPNASLANSRQRADQIRAAFETLAATLVGDLDAEVTISVGAVVYPDHGRDVDALITNVDFALYRAKQRGGNRVEGV